MANSVIEQEPLYNSTLSSMPVGQDIIFVISNDTAVANETKVKFLAQVHIGSTPINLSNTDNLIATFKTTPNNAGVGIFDFRNIIENYVSSDNMAYAGSKYKTTTTSDDDRHSLHIINQFSKGSNALRFMAIQFKVEYLGAGTDPNVVSPATGTAANSDQYIIFNGYLKYTDVLTLGTAPNASDFGFDISDFEFGSTAKKFLTNAPTTQYANLEDYGTLAFLQTSASLSSTVNDILITYYSSAGASLGTDTITKEVATGAYPVSAFFWLQDVSRFLLYFGCYPGNLRGDTTNTFTSLITAGTIQGGYYTVVARDATPTATSATYTINLNCPNIKDYESIRLCWLNQWGAWDYHTFTKKSTRSISTQGSTYNQLAGSWNEGKYRIDSYKGGKKAFRRNATETIRINTDYINVDNNTTLEELINSPEVYLLDGFQTDGTNAALNQYVTPVRLTTSSFTRKTVANDKLIQYTFEIEKSKTFRTQSV